MTLLLNSSMLLLSHQANACGGFFCDNVNPVNQSAERILFAQHAEEGMLEMHIQIQYAGPPTDFGWILPTAPDVETSLSSAELFNALDQQFGPRFVLNQSFGESCADIALASPESGAVDDGGNRGVQVLSREAVGPYDRAILAAQSIEDLRAWLDENQFEIPESFDAKLQPYLEVGAAFVVIKLLPGQDSSDIVPLRLTFSGTRPAIPIIPTSVAATPDMGVIVHMLADHRAVPVNYRHVIINEAAIEWNNQGANYPDVVSQAADEAGGQAFVTDFAGPHEDQITRMLNPYDEDTLTRVSMATNLVELMRVIQLFSSNRGPNADLLRVLSNQITPPEGNTVTDVLNCPSCFDEDFSLDGAAIAEQIRNEINPAYETLNELLTRLPYLTRLYTTLSADEMTNDPLFSTNPDLEDMPNIRRATNFQYCDEDGNFTSSSILLSDGRVLDEPITRQEGETVRGMDTPGAARVEQMFEAGQPEILMEAQFMEPQETMAGEEVMAGEEEMAGEAMTDEEMNEGSKDSDSGCQQNSTAAPVPLLIFLVLSVLLRRQRQTVA